jgi:hypothetical protein
MLTWLLAFILYFWLALALLVVSVLTRALVLTVLWGWFVEPTFGFAPLSLPMAAGLITVVYLVISSQNFTARLRERSRRDAGDEKKGSLAQSVHDVGTVLLNELVTPTTALAFGWLLKQVVG